MEENEIHALGDYVILEPLEDGESRTPSGLLIPATVTKSEKLYHRYRVVSVGPDCTDDHMSEIPESSLYPGDIVLVSPQSTGQCHLGGREYGITTYDQVAAVLHEPIRRVDGDAEDDADGDSLRGDGLDELH